VAAAKKDKHSGELAKFVKAWNSLGAPTGSGPEQALCVLLARNGTREGAKKACDVMWNRYIDINEVRIANPEEVGDLIGEFVKNDPEDVAHHLRGFLREYYKHRNTLDFGEWRSHTPEQMRKYLDGTEWFPGEIALVIFFQLLSEELAEEEEVEPLAEGDAKPKKRTEREAGLALDRIRMACAFAAFGESPSKAKQSIAHRKVTEAFKFGPVPELPPPPPPPTIPQIVVPPAGGSKVALKVVKTPAAKKVAKKAAAKPAVPKAARKVAKKAAAKKVAKKTAAKKVAKKAAKKAAKKTAVKKKTATKTSASRAGGGARPRTTRATRSPSKSKKSSRR